MSDIIAGKPERWAVACYRCGARFSVVGAPSERSYCSNGCRSATGIARPALYRRSAPVPIRQTPAPPDLPAEPWVTTSHTGAASELVVAVDLIRRGWYVFRALMATGPFDIVAYRDGQTLLVEVKSRRPGVGGVIREPRHSHEVHDTLAVVTADDVVYFGKHP